MEGRRWADLRLLLCSRRISENNHHVEGIGKIRMTNDSAFASAGRAGILAPRPNPDKTSPFLTHG